MSAAGRHQRREERKYKRLPVRFGHAAPEHSAYAQQISTGGLFLSTNQSVLAEGSTIVVEIAGPQETWVVSGIVRHAIKVHPNLANFTRPGMGVELTSLPDACRAFLASL